MSGGYFDYRQYSIEEIAETMEQIVNDNNKTQHLEIPDDIIEKMKEAVTALRKAYAMTREIDLFLSGDNGAESFLEAWKENVK